MRYRAIKEFTSAFGNYKGGDLIDPELSPRYVQHLLEYNLIEVITDGKGGDISKKFQGQTELKPSSSLQAAQASKINNADLQKECEQKDDAESLPSIAVSRQSANLTQSTHATVHGGDNTQKKRMGRPSKNGQVTNGQQANGD